jgi:nitrate reductase NapE component
MTDARDFGLLLIGGWVLLSVAFLGAWSFLLHCYRQRFPR